MQSSVYILLDCRHTAAVARIYQMLATARLLKFDHVLAPHCPCLLSIAYSNIRYLCCCQSDQELRDAHWQAKGGRF
jgi:hypothetical protein